MDLIKDTVRKIPRQYRRALSITIPAMALVVALTGVVSAITPTSTVTSFCTDLGNRLGGVSIPNGDVCDIVLVRTTPTITSATMPGVPLNKFTLMNSVIEFTGMDNADLTGTTAGNQKVMVMGDFALMETELNDVLPLLAQYGWTTTGIHNHMIEETPKMTFLHWDTSGNIQTIIDQLRTIIGKTTIPAIPGNPGTSSSPSPTASGSPMSPSPTATAGTVTLAIVKHLCPSDIRSENDIPANQDKFTLCPAMLMPSSSPMVSPASGSAMNPSLTVRFRNSAGSVETLMTDPTMHGSSMEWSVPRSDVTITEQSPAGTHFGFVVADTGDSGSLSASGDGVINLDTRNDADGHIMLHLFNLRD